MDVDEDLDALFNGEGDCFSLLDDMLNEEEGMDYLNISETVDIEAFCAWEGTIYHMSFPTQATGWQKDLIVLKPKLD